MRHFSNYIEGTEFEVEEAAEIVFKGRIPRERPADAHDILGVWRVVSDQSEMRAFRTPPMSWSACFAAATPQPSAGDRTQHRAHSRRCRVASAQ